MCQSNNCCQDYSLLKANTGIATINTANPNLDGSGSTTTVLTAGLNGTIIKSITIKAAAPATTGMVRLYLKNATDTILYKEVPIPVTPELKNTPTPTPVLPMFETMLIGDLKLEAGMELKASTQTRDTFNIIAEGLDWDYPATLPTDCCNFKQTVAVTGVDKVDTANTNLNGTGNIAPVFTAATSNGTYVKSVTIKALQSTSINGAIRLFLSPDGIQYTLLREIMIPETQQSAYTPSFKQVIDLGFNLESGYVIGVSTQLSEAYGITIEGESWSYPI
jgi:hypothetical protein